MATTLDLSRLAIHTITTKPWGLDTAIAKYAAAGVKRHHGLARALEGHDIRAAGSAHPRRRAHGRVALPRRLFPVGRRRDAGAAHRGQPRAHRRGRGPGRAAHRARLRRRSRQQPRGIARPDRRGIADDRAARAAAGVKLGHRAAAPDVCRHPLGHEHPRPVGDGHVRASGRPQRGRRRRRLSPLVGPRPGGPDRAPRGPDASSPSTSATGGARPSTCSTTAA